MTKTSRSLVLLAVVGCWSCSEPAFLNVPTSPSATLPTETARGSGLPIAERLRRVEGISSGEGGCGDGDSTIDACLPPGRVRLAASGGSLQGEYAGGFQRLDNVHIFAVESFNLNGIEGSRPLADTSGLMEFSVRENARVLIQLSFPGGAQRIEGSAVPTFRLDNDGQCLSGRRLTTTFELTLEYLGKTSVTDTHCTAT